jgi:8-oxo-dGTP pyrophosphatase MutT (NUDIX family)
VRERIRSALATRRPVEIPVGDRRAAGVLLLLEGGPGDERIVFQVRTQTVRHHRGEISFPGGRHDPDDLSLLHTALRETHEEVGVPPEAVAILGQLDDTFTRGSNYLIRPFVGLVEEGVHATVTAQREVSELLRVPVAHLLDPASHIWKVTDWQGQMETTPAYEYGEHVIWGATARMLGQFLGLIEEAHR